MFLYCFYRDKQQSRTHAFRGNKFLNEVRTGGRATSNPAWLVTLTIDQKRTKKDQLDACDTVQVGDQPPTSREVFETKMNDRR